MIVFSLVLILVAVTLLVLGLTAGSSSLLIASIAVSLLAAIALVIGARRAATARRTPVVPDEAAPPYAEPLYAEPPVSGRRRAATDVMGKGNTPAGAGDHIVETMATGNTPAGAAAEPVAGPDHAEAAAYAAGRRDADEALAGESYPDEPILDFTDEPVALAEEEPVTRRAPRGEQPDYDRASGFIGGARAPEQPVDSIWDDPATGEAAPVASADPPDDPGPSGPVEEHSEELAEADPEDPADEPRPQTIRPGDAVRVARMDNEVLVVDGRPRYHLSDCPHLIGRETEGLPVAEAVELGFTPCGLCRPADRLVAAAARG
jgi:hypothetical protein